MKLIQTNIENTHTRTHCCSNFYPVCQSLSCIHPLICHSLGADCEFVSGSILKQLSAVGSSVSQHCNNLIVLRGPTMPAGGKIVITQ